uniref:Uncharacterized protein n=1 Tax=Anguilla anguilla TaxID=7936 RepID=A0A0E9V4R1_ANGAN
MASLTRWYKKYHQKAILKHGERHTSLRPLDQS